MFEVWAAHTAHTSNTHATFYESSVCESVLQYCYKYKFSEKVFKKKKKALFTVKQLLFPVAVASDVSG